MCQLYEEEQVGKTWEGRKTVQTSKMPDLGWDIAEAQLQETQYKPEDNTTHTAPCLQLLITIAIIITAILEQLAVYVREVLKIIKKTVQAVKSMTMKASRNRLMQNIKDSYKTAALVVNIVTSTTNRTDSTKQQQTSNRNPSTHPGM